MKRLILTFIGLISITFVYAQWTNSGSFTYLTNSSYKVGINTTSPVAKFEVVGPGTSLVDIINVKNNASGNIQIYSGSSTSSHLGSFLINRSRGTVTSPSAVSANDFVGAFGGSAYINSAYRNIASIQMNVGSNPGTTSYPGTIVFSTIASNGTALAERMRISELGYVGIGNNNPQNALEVNGTVKATSFLLGTAPLVSSQWATSGSNINFTAGIVSIATTTAPSGYKLAVGGKIISEEVVVKYQANWPDYVFETDYKLPSLSELELFIKANKHLPEVPTASEVAVNGLSLGQMNATLLKKIEELTLYVIELKKENDVQQKLIDELRKE